MLLSRGVHFPHVHDINRLLTLMDESGAGAPHSLDEAGVLTQYAVLTRYPGVLEPVSEAQYAKALSLAEAVVAWAATQIADGC